MPALDEIQKDIGVVIEINSSASVKSKTYPHILETIGANDALGTRTATNDVYDTPLIAIRGNAHSSLLYF
jgi:hypothetical protein